MKLNFRQGLQHAPMVSGHPSFLTYNAGTSTITINVGSDLVRATVAHEDYNYLIEERTDTVNAWGPFNWVSSWGTEPGGNYSLYLYWNINRSTGLMSHGFTPRVPIYGGEEEPGSPVIDQRWVDLNTNTIKVWNGSTWGSGSPAVDQHWFDLTTNTMMVWDGSAWRKVIRVFAAEFTKGTQTIRSEER